MTMPEHNIFAMTFAKVYPLYVQKAVGKNRTKKEVDQIICWLTRLLLSPLTRRTNVALEPPHRGFLGSRSQTAAR
jgi:hypothetical protein